MIEVNTFKRLQTAIIEAFSLQLPQQLLAPPPAKERVPSNRVSHIIKDSKERTKNNHKAPTDNKRRRIAAAGGSPQEVRCLTDLPSGILAHAASFLAAPSKALFAIALDENSDASPNERSSAIVGNQWATLDFGEIEKELAAKLNDDNIEKVLLCIDAVNRVKRLMLTNCFNITGAGLEPLRGSLIIEQIDLSLVAHHKSPNLEPAPPISCDHVLPILDSIISQAGCQLKHMDFPSVWRNFPVHHELLPFLTRYDQMLQNRDRYICLECDTNLPAENEEDWIVRTECQYFATQNSTCCVCLKHYCHECEVARAVYALNFCVKCKKYYCVKCVAMDQCNYCGDYSCCICNTYTRCFKCHWNICGDCDSKNKGCTNCSISGGDCIKLCCKKCSQGDTMGGVKCPECGGYFCINCLTRRYNSHGMSNCSECTRRVARFAPSFLEEKERLSEDSNHRREEVKMLRDEIGELKNKIKEMGLQNE
eukprot:scaffold1983_cov84-Skeletonema_dohrnii-CCMP3373.AAC.1